jgi:hypothetical protein
MLQMLALGAAVDQRLLWTHPEVSGMGDNRARHPHTLMVEGYQACNLLSPWEKADRSRRKAYLYVMDDDRLGGTRRSGLKVCSSRCLRGVPVPHHIRDRSQGMALL